MGPGRPKKNNAIRSGQPPTGYSYLNFIVHDSIKAAIKTLANSRGKSIKDLLQVILLSTEDVRAELSKRELASIESGTPLQPSGIEKSTSGISKKNELKLAGYLKTKPQPSNI